MNPVERVTNAARLYGRGIVCPGVLWDLVVAGLAGRPPREVFESCLPEIRHQLRRAYRDRPNTGGLIGSEAREAIKAWCEKPPLTNTSSLAARIIGHWYWGREKLGPPGSLLSRVLGAGHNGG